MSTPPRTQAGWHNHPTDPTLLQFWDGSAWTDHTAPRRAAKRTTSGLTKGILIGAGSLIAIGAISGIAIAANGAREPSAKPAVTEQTATAQPTPAAVASTLVIDVATFKNESYRDLEDFEKDLNDMVATVDDGGFWRLISNSAELNFTLGKLQDHGAPGSVTADWTAGLATLDASLTSLADSVSSGDSAAIKAAIEVSRGEVNALRGIVDRTA